MVIFEIFNTNIIFFVPNNNLLTFTLLIIALPLKSNIFKIHIQNEDFMQIKTKYAVTLILFFAANIFSQNVYEFLRLENSPRAAALAESFVAGNDDPNIIFYNPAGIALLTETPVSFSFLKHLLDINSASISASHEFENIGRFGAAIKFINYGSFTERDEFGNENGTFSANEMAFILGYANLLGENFYYGANVKFIYSGIAGYSSTGFAADLGLHYEIPESNWNFGFVILNAGSQFSSYGDTKENLPVDVRLGVAKKMAHIPVKLFFSFNRLNDDQDNFFERFKAFTFGGEITFSKVLCARLGYDNQKRKDYKFGSTAGLAGVSVGLGINVSDYRIDYGLSSYGKVGSLHRFGVSTSF